MLAILGERRRHRHAERLLLDPNVDSELAQHLVKAGVEVGDRDTVGEVERPAAAVVGAYEQCMVEEVEVDLKGGVFVMQPPGREAAHVDVERRVPPVVARRRGCNAYLADDLAVQVQRVLGRTPVGQVELRQRHRATARRKVIAL